MFHAQKSSFSDKYYFNVYIGKENTDFYGDCYYNRIVTDCPLDWQTIADDEMIKFLENDIVSQLMHIIETPLHLGKETMIGEHCECDNNNVLPAGYRKKADTNGTMDIKRFSDSYSVLAVNEPGESVYGKESKC